MGDGMARSDPKRLDEDVPMFDIEVSSGGGEREHDPELFFPVSGEDTDKGEMEWVAAKRICEMECPVRTECLSYALDNRLMYGVWGGRSEDERRGMLRRREPARARVTT